MAWPASWQATPDRRHRGRAVDRLGERQRLVERVVVVRQIASGRHHLDVVDTGPIEQHLRRLGAGHAVERAHLGVLLEGALGLPAGEQRQQQRRDHENQIHRVEEHLVNLRSDQPTALRSAVIPSRKPGPRRAYTRAGTAMMKFEHDVFISYAHLDDEAVDPGAEGWVSALHRALAVRVSQLVGERASIFRDPKLQGNDVFADSLTDKLHQTALLVSVLTPRYSMSEWCMREVQEFSSASARRGHPRRRQDAPVQDRQDADPAFGSAAGAAGHPRLRVLRRRPGDRPRPRAGPPLRRRPQTALLGQARRPGLRHERPATGAQGRRDPRWRRRQRRRDRRDRLSRRDHRRPAAGPRPDPPRPQAPRPHRPAGPAAAGRRRRARSPRARAAGALPAIDPSGRPRLRVHP